MFSFKRKKYPSRPRRVVITGVGVITGNAKGKDDYWQALKDGRIGYRPVTLFDTSSFKVNIAGEVNDFNAELYVGNRSLRLLDRSTRLMICSARLAIDDSQFHITEENTDDVGVSVGTTLGSIKSIADFDEAILTEGPRFVNPALFPNTVINSPASQVSIWNYIKGFNTTISTGFTSYGFYALKFMSGSRDGDFFVNCPFDKRRNGIRGPVCFVLRNMNMPRPAMRGF